MYLTEYLSLQQNFSGTGLDKPHLEGVGAF